MLARRVITTPAGSLRASTPYLFSGATTEPSHVFGEHALRQTASVNELDKGLWSLFDFLATFS